MNRFIKCGLVVVGVLLVATVVLPLAFPGREPLGKVTRQRMAFDRVRILEYGHVHGQLPPNLQALPPLPQKPGTDHHLEDAWGRAIAYEFDAPGTVTLKSLGRDGAQGGSGEDADIVFKFPSRNADGSWVEYNYLTYDSYTPPRQ